MKLLITSFLFLGANSFAVTPDAGKLTPATDFIRRSTVFLKSIVSETITTEDSYNCTGVIVAPEHLPPRVWTAKHCCKHFGDHPIKISFSQNAQGKVFPTSYTITNTRAPFLDRYDDACSIPIEGIPDGFTAINIADENTKFTNDDRLIIAGYGPRNEADQHVPQLRFGYTNFNRRATSSVGEYLVLENGNYWRSWTNQEAVADEGDSGGPVILESEKGPILIGLISKEVAVGGKRGDAVVDVTKLSYDMKHARSYPALPSTPYSYPTFKLSVEEQSKRDTVYLTPVNEQGIPSGGKLGPSFIKCDHPQYGSYLWDGEFQYDYPFMLPKDCKHVMEFIKNHPDQIIRISIDNRGKKLIIVSDLLNREL